MTTDHNNVGTGSGVEGGGGGVPAASPNFTTQWSLNSDARWAYEAASTVGVHTTAADAHTTGQGLVQNIYTFYTDDSNYERWYINTGYGGGGFRIQHQAVGTYNGSTRAMTLSPTDWLNIGDGLGILPGASTMMLGFGGGAGYGWKGIVLSASAEPTTPQGNAAFILYVDQADGKLKAKGASGTVTPLANP